MEKHYAMTTPVQRRALAIAIEAIHFHRKACQDLEQYGRMDLTDRKAILDRIFDNLEEVDGERGAEQILMDMMEEQ
jgi:hypothetical protein